jgi:hypothetical protein
MAVCFSCKNKIAFIERTERIGEEDNLYCFNCLKKMEKDKVLLQMYENGAPEEFFRIPEITCKGQNSKDLQTLQIGDLVFTDKGIFFIKITESRQHAFYMRIIMGFIMSSSSFEMNTKLSNSHSLYYIIIMTMMLVFITIRLTGFLNNRAYKKAWDAAVADGRVEQSANLDEFALNSKRIIMFPRETIRKIKYSKRKGLMIKCTDKKETFRFQDKKKMHSLFDTKIIKYTDSRYASN